MYIANVTLHVFAAVFWLGGMFFLAAVGAPVLRTVEPPELRALLFRRLGQQFRVFGWSAIGVLLITGVFNLHFRGVLSLDVLGSGAFWTGAYGRILALKLGAVAAMLIVQAVHDFHLGPAASRMKTDSDAMLAMRRRAALLARFSAVLGVIVIVAAVVLARVG